MSRHADKKNVYFYVILRHRRHRIGLKKFNFYSNLRHRWVLKAGVAEMTKNDRRTPLLGLAQPKRRRFGRGHRQKQFSPWNILKIMY